MACFNKYQTKQLHTHSSTCTHSSWWRVLGWVTTICAYKMIELHETRYQVIIIIINLLMTMIIKKNYENLAFALNHQFGVFSPLQCSIM